MKIAWMINLALIFSVIIFPQQIGYSDFNSGLNGWITVNGSSINKWEIGNATGYNLSSGVYISNDGGTSNSYSTDKSSVVHLYKDIDFSQPANTLVLSFRWRCSGEESFDYLSVHVVPTSVTPVAGVELNQGQLSGSELSGSDYYRGKRFNISDKITEPTMRVVFTWRNNESGGTQTPAAIDNVEFTNLDLANGMWKQHTAINPSRYYAAPLRNSFGMISIGGLNPSNVPLNLASEYNMIADRWEQLPALSNSFSHSTAVRSGGYVYNIGGFKDGGDPTDEVWRLSLSNFTWEPFTNYSKKIFYGKSLSLSGNLYVVGGSDENDVLLNDVNVLESGSNTWTPATPLPGDGRADGGLAKLDRFRLLYVGGYTNSFDNLLQVDSVFVGTINPDNPADITWVSGANFPGGSRARFQAFHWGDGKAVVVGGSSDAGFGSFNDTWLYDADTDSWSELGIWSQLPNKPTPITAYQGTSFNLFDNTWMLFIAGGVTTGPAVTGINEAFVDTVETPVSVQLLNNEIPTEYFLAQNYPNPFNPETRIRYKIPSETNVTLKVYDVLGREIAVLVDKEQYAGIYEVVFNGKNLSSGIYFYKLETDNYSDSKKLLLLK